MSVRQSWDLVVIGGGIAGVTTAIGFAASGGSVALIEAHHPGEPALTANAVSAHAFFASARIAHHLRRAADFGLLVDPPTVDFAAIRHRASNIVATIDQRHPPEALTAAGVTPITGLAHFVDSQTVRVDEDLHIGDQIVIATGSTPTIPDIPGLRRSHMVTADTIFDRTTLPDRLAVIGGGFTGLELGQAFARLGSDVTIIDRNTRIPHTIEPDHAIMLQRRLEAEGIRVLTDTTVTAVATEEGSDHSTLSLTHAAGEQESIDADCILVATGRQPNIEHLGLDNAGVSVVEHQIELDDLLQTNLEHIFACGDVTGGPNLANRAEQQALAVVTNLRGGASRWHPGTMPWTLFTDPPVAGIGQTHAAARATHGDRLEIVRMPLTDLDRAITDGDADGEILIILNPGWLAGRGGGEIVGAHVIGPSASEVINQLEPFMRWRLPAAALAHTAPVQPTYTAGPRQALMRHRRDDESTTAPSMLSRLRRWWRD